MQANGLYSSSPLVRTSNIKADLHEKGGKMGTKGLEPQAESAQPLTDVNPQDRRCIRNAILLVVESFNN
jgi:hypothetical protein